MAVKGAIAKQEVTKKILETFEGSFLNEKEIRIPWVEDGERIQLKVTLTAAKTLVNVDSEEAIPGNAATSSQETLDAPKVESIETSAEEKEHLSQLLRSLGL